LSVLQGMLDAAAGPITQAGRSCRVQYPTAPKQVRADVLFLVHSLGGIVNVRTRSTARRATGGRRESYVLDIRLPEGIEPFRRAQKAARYAAHGGGRPLPFIHSIEEAGTEEAVCIRVAAPDALYVTEDFLLTHNTLNDSFIILDEAQNTTAEQMKMFLTRLGFGSKIVVTGDVTQVDLPNGARSGLRAAS